MSDKQVETILPSVQFTLELLWVELHLLSKNLGFLWRSLLFAIEMALLYLAAFVNDR